MNIFGILFFGFIFSSLNLTAQDNAVAPIISDSAKTVNFNKKEYDELVKKILKAEGPSSLKEASAYLVKDSCYTLAAGALGFAASTQSDTQSIKVAYALIAFALSYSTMRLTFSHLLAPKDSNLKNLEDFEKYIKQTLESEESLTKRDSDLIMRLFEKDYDLILNKVDQDHGAGIIKRAIKFMVKYSTFMGEASIFGLGIFALILGSVHRHDGLDFWNHPMDAIENGVVSSLSGFAYFIALVILFDFIFASKDPRVAKIEKFRDIVQFFEEAKIRKLEAQHESIAKNKEAC